MLSIFAHSQSCSLSPTWPRRRHVSFLGLSLLICANAGVRKAEYFRRALASFLPQMLPEAAVGEKGSGEWPGFSGNKTGCRAAVPRFPNGNCGLWGLRLFVLGGEITALSLGGATLPRNHSTAPLFAQLCAAQRGSPSPAASIGTAAADCSLYISGEQSEWGWGGS